MKPIDPPKHKKEWPGKYLSLDAPCPEGRVDAALVYIERRKNAKDTMHTPHDVSRWGSVRVLQVSWRCQLCGAYHSGYIPERWIEEEKAIFIAKEKT